MGRKTNSLENILTKTIRDEESGCLNFTGAVNHAGYPLISSQGKMCSGGRLIYEKTYGKVPEGCDIDHVCHNRRCVEKTHLRPLSHRQNIIQTKAYIEKRHQRLKSIFERYPQVELYPTIVITSTCLKKLWSCTGKIRQILQTMQEAFPDEFSHSRVEEGRGRKPDLYAISIQSSLIEKLFSEEVDVAASLREESLVRV